MQTIIKDIWILEIYKYISEKKSHRYGYIIYIHTIIPYASP